MRFNTITWQADEPSNLTFTSLIAVQPKDTNTVERIVRWLRNNGDEGGALAVPKLGRWEYGGYADFVGIEDVADEIALQSRYNETDTPGEHYARRCAVLEGICRMHAKSSP